jgi:hypothetical protein
MWIAADKSSQKARKKAGTKNLRLIFSHHIIDCWKLLRRFSWGKAFRSLWRFFPAENGKVLVATFCVDQKLR